MLPRNDKQQQNNSGNQNGPNTPRWIPGIRILLLIGTLLLLWSVFGGTPQPPTLQLPYSTFLEQVRSGNVEQVEMVGQRISGELEEPIEPPEDVQVVGGTPFAQSTGEIGRFSSTLPYNGDDRLLELLDEQGVMVQAREEQPNILLNLLFSLLPVALLIGVIIFFMRQQMRGQQGMFNFGRSRAKSHSIDRPTVKFGDVAGADEAKNELVEVVDFLKQPDRYKQLGARIPRGVLLVGPPGTGKTLLARSVAGEAGVPFFSTSASEFVEMFVGVGASRVRDLFEQARRNAPAIIFIDELDAIGRQRGAGMGGGNDEREQTLNQILVEMDGFEASTDVIIIAATNRPDVLDPALLRPGRFDRQVTVALPDIRGRQAVLDIHLKGKPSGPDIDSSVLARQTPGFSGADLANLVNEAALHAARAGSKLIRMQHFAEARDKIILGTVRPLLMTDHDRRVTAYHEAGHALVALLLPESDPVNKVTIIPRGRALGVTEYLPENDRVNYSRQYLLSQLAMALAGRAAEQVAIGEITTGAENDLQRATQIARRMIGRWGMSEEMGLLFADDENSNPFLGREMAGPRNHSEATAARLDEGVRDLLDDRFQTALRLLNENREALERIAQGLLTHETIDRDGILAALKGNDVPPPGSGTSTSGQANPGTNEPPVLNPKPGALPA
jgi:cell division protease FtsH